MSNGHNTEKGTKMAKCKSCGQDMAEHVNFCPNCGASSKTGKEGNAISAMDEETIYTDEQIQDIAERIAKNLRETPNFMMPIVLFKIPEFHRGPLAFMAYDSKDYNPLGKFPVEADSLTKKQKTIVTKIVGKAMSQVGIDRDRDISIGKDIRTTMGKRRFVVGMSRSELADAKEQGRMDTIFRAINNKR